MDHPLPQYRGRDTAVMGYGSCGVLHSGSLRALGLQVVGEYSSCNVHRFIQHTGTPHSVTTT